MSEHLLKILLDELDIIRFRCRNGTCAGVVEAPLAALEQPGRVPLACTLCGKEFFSSTHGETPVQLLARAMRQVREKGSDVTTEFVLPVKD